MEKIQLDCGKRVYYSSVINGRRGCFKKSKMTIETASFLRSDVPLPAYAPPSGAPVPSRPTFATCRLEHLVPVSSGLVTPRAPRPVLEHSVPSSWRHPTHTLSHTYPLLSLTYLTSFHPSQPPRSPTPVPNESPT